MKPKYSGLKVPKNFFPKIPTLQVLHLIELDLTRFPKSLGILINLQTLCLLGDVTIVGNMKELKALSFRGSDIKTLPGKMCELIHLKLLDLRDCEQLTSIPSKILSSLTSIEALYLNGASASLNSWNRLSHLNILEMVVPTSKECRSLPLSKLKRYKITVGSNWDNWGPNPFSHDPDPHPLPAKNWITSQLRELEALELVGKTYSRCSVDDSKVTGFPNLKDLHVHNSDALCIVKSKCSAVLPALEKLKVRNMTGLRTLKSLVLIL